jgi:hypothetical protein
VIPCATRYGSDNHLEDRGFEWRGQLQPQLEQVRVRPILPHSRFIPAVTFYPL